ncbi:MAG: hypothetical protein WBD02_07745 [Acidimicrobiia bacterium]
MRFLRTLLFAVLACVAGPWSATHASAASLHRAAIIVDNGNEVTTVVVDFPEDSISGLELLNRAGYQPETYGFSGLGAAVCRMAAKGCAADQSCLNCDSGNFWSYFRAPNGSHTLASSSVGASTARVSDGDTDGWKYGTGDAPTFVNLLGTADPPVPAPQSTEPSSSSTVGTDSEPSSSSTVGAGAEPSSSSTVGTGAEPSSSSTFGTSSSQASAPSAPPAVLAPTTTPTSIHRLHAMRVTAKSAAPSGARAAGNPFPLIALGVGFVGIGAYVERRRRVVRAAQAP